MIFLFQQQCEFRSDKKDTQQNFIKFGSAVVLSHCAL